MLKELDYFWVGEEYGGRQSLLPDFIMRFAGCAAVTACDSLIYMALYKNKNKLCPFSTDKLRGRDYVSFFKTVKPYLRPRFGGINKLDIFEGARAYDFGRAALVRGPDGAKYRGYDQAAD